MDYNLTASGTQQLPDTVETALLHSVREMDGWLIF